MRLFSRIIHLLFFFFVPSWGAQLNCRSESCIDETLQSSRLSNFETIAQSEQESFIWEDEIPDESKSRHQEKRKIEIFFKRYRRIGAPAIFLSHGFTNNYSMMEFAGRFFYHQGFDVFMSNHLGSGNPGEESKTTPYKPGDYGFVNIVRSYDITIPAILEMKKQENLDQGIKESPRELMVMGFSMGGMTLKDWEKGLIEINNLGSHVYDEDTGRKRQKMIKGNIFVGSPPNSLEGLGPAVEELVKIISKILGSKAPIFNGFLPIGLGGSSYSTINGIKSILRSAFDKLSPFIPDNFIRPFINAVGNLDEFGDFKTKLGAMLATNHSDPHSDIVNSLKNMKFRNQKDMGKMAPITVPTFVVAGDRDQLANADLIKKDFDQMKKRNPNMRFFRSEINGHLDLMFAPFIARISTEYARFSQNPNGFFNRCLRSYYP
ncbi:MAG: hypothetical protein J0M15_02345 [Deltaproteobacteria bacterium]|jgi:esterase/lipase|nr:hypothetical protein [Deltaproteobacteria bacterium]